MYRHQKETLCLKGWRKPNSFFQTPLLCNHQRRLLFGLLQNTLCGYILVLQQNNRCLWIYRYKHFLPLSLTIPLMGLLEMILDLHTFLNIFQTLCFRLGQMF